MRILWDGTLKKGNALRLFESYFVLDFVFRVENLFAIFIFVIRLLCFVWVGV